MSARRWYNSWFGISWYLAFPLFALFGSCLFWQYQGCCRSNRCYGSFLEWRSTAATTIIFIVLVCFIFFIFFLIARSSVCSWTKQMPLRSSDLCPKLLLNLMGSMSALCMWQILGSESHPTISEFPMCICISNLAHNIQHTLISNRLHLFLSCNLCILKTQISNYLCPFSCVY